MEIKLPQLGEGADSGVVVKILVQEGDRVEKDQTLLELENEKAVAPIPATAAGTVTKLHVKEGDTVNVGEPIATVSGDGEDGGDSGKKEKTTKRREKQAERPARREAQQEGRGSGKERPGGTKSRRDGSAEKAGLEPAASPSLRTAARRLGIHLSQVPGSGRGGRIEWDDLREYIEWLQDLAFEREAPGEERQKTEPRQPEVDFSKWGAVRTEKISATRKAIGAKMARSWATVPHVTQFGEADLTGLLRLKKKHDAAYEKKEARLTLTAFFLKALVPLLEKYPHFNASLSADGEEVIFKQYFHLSVAVDTEQGLLAPVLRDVDKKSMLDLSKELADLADKARQRKLTSEEMQGGCFTFSNLGGIGGSHFTPIVNQPETGILGAGRGEWRPRVTDRKKGKIEPRLIVPLALSYDHRLIDGAVGAKFITDLAAELADFPEKMLKT